MKAQKYIIEVSVKNDKGEREWKGMRPSHSDTPYEFDSEDEAYRTMNSCYPCKISRRVRITIKKP